MIDETLIRRLPRLEQLKRDVPARKQPSCAEEALLWQRAEALQQGTGEDLPGLIARLSAAPGRESRQAVLMAYTDRELVVLAVLLGEAPAPSDAPFFSPEEWAALGAVGVWEGAPW